MVDHVLLCLKCRGKGHDVEHCPMQTWAGELDWFFSQARRFIDPSVEFSDTEEVICARCEKLDLIRFFETNPPWKTQMDFTDKFDEKVEFIRSLGKTGSVLFWADCSVCYCLFAITPQPSSTDQEIFLVPDWTISRLSGELGAVTMDSPEKRHYATCLLSVLKPSSLSLGTRVTAHRGDALCILDENIGPQRTLGGRRIDSHDIDISRIVEWVEKCSKNHDDSCLPIATRELEEIRLMEVDTRKIVKYPGSDCEYIALSYVWGKVSQESYSLYSTVSTLPETLEDAILLTKKLGKKYIWIDSVCIMQSDEKDKTNQINRMWSIYRGAWVTLIALSGDSARAGFSRLSRKDYHPQLECRVRSKTLVGLMPTLSQQIWTCPWGRRAWTLQEGLLSPRCLYISDHQIYFDCSSMQCCESLDDSRSWAHSLTPTSNPTTEGFVTWMLRQAGAGALRIPLDWPSRRLEHWGEKLNLYSYRSMKYREDTIRAFDGVLQRLETIYPGGFFWGLPLEDLDWALAWRSQVPPTRRDGFPTWSWAGWKGPLFFGQPIDVKKTRRIPTSLDISASKEGRIQRIFNTDGDKPSSGNDIGIVIVNDPIYKSAQEAVNDPEFNLDDYPAAEEAGYLFITAICFKFIPNFSNPHTGTFKPGQNETFSFRIQDVHCLIRIFSTDSSIPGTWIGEQWVMNQEDQKEETFLLLARDHIQGFILHQLMLLDIQDQSSIAERVTILELLVPLDELEVLREFKPQKRRIVLV